jgi:benzoylformate decarboxylase
VTFVVMNNREYNILKNFLRSHTTTYRAGQNRPFIAMDIDRPAIDFVHLAQSMGLPARRVDRAADIAPAIEAGIASGQANLVEIVISTE